MDNFNDSIDEYIYKWRMSNLVGNFEKLNDVQKTICYASYYLRNYLNGGILQFFVNCSDFNFSEMLQLFKNNFSKEIYENFKEAKEIYDKRTWDVLPHESSKYTQIAKLDPFQKQDQYFYENNLSIELENFIKNNFNFLNLN